MSAARTKTTTNPWLGIPADDYEGHMGPDWADQLAPLSEIFADVYRDTRPARLALLGCATGNGLEHVDPAITTRAIAVDVNPEYVARARARHQALGSVLDVRCADVCACELTSGSLDLIHAALIFEHVDAPLLAARIATWLAPGGTCAVVLQVDGVDDGSTRAPAPAPAPAPVMSSPFRSIASLGASMRMLSPARLAELLGQHGLRQRRRWTVPVKNHKRFEVALFGAVATPSPSPFV